MKVSRTAAVLVGCVALAATATADVASGAAAQTGTKTKPGNQSDEIEAVSSAGNGHHHHHSTKKRAGHRALRGVHADGEGAKAAKKDTHNKKRSLKQKAAPAPAPADNRAYSAAAAANNKNGQKQQQAVDNTPYVNNRYDYLDRYANYLTAEQLQSLRNPNPANNSPLGPSDDQETTVGGAVVVSTPAGSAGRPATATTTSSSYTQTAAVQQQQQQQPQATTQYVSTLDLNRGSDANGADLETLNRGVDVEAPIPGYDAATGYGSTGNGGNANANVNTNGGSGALDPIVQTTEWKPIDKSVWVEHFVPGIGDNPNANPSGGTWAGSANSNAGFPNRNPALSNGGSAGVDNRISANESPCNGANPSAGPTQDIETIFRLFLWGECSTTAGCRPGSCCLIRPGVGGACVAFDEICLPGQSASDGDCPYSWITSDKCACDNPL